MDLIDKRNMRDKIARSIIKSYNVHYISQQELDRQKAEEEAQKAKELRGHLAAEEAGDSSRQDNLDSPDNQGGRNANPKAYSGEYSRKMPEDEVTQSQIEKILAEKEQEFMRTLEQSLENT